MNGGSKRRGETKRGGDDQERRERADQVLTLKMGEEKRSGMKEPEVV